MCGDLRSEEEDGRHAEEEKEEEKSPLPRKERVDFLLPQDADECGGDRRREEHKELPKGRAEEGEEVLSKDEDDGEQGAEVEHDVDESETSALRCIPEDTLQKEQMSAR